MSKKNPGPMQWLLVGGAAVMIIALSAISTIYLSGGEIKVGALGRKVASSFGMNFYSPTMTDAQLVCEQATKTHYGERIRVFHVDMLSTREDRAAGVYKVFLEVELYEFEDRKGLAWLYFVTCEVDSASAEISLFKQVRSESPDAPAVKGRKTLKLVL